MASLAAGTPVGETAFRPLTGWEQLLPVLVALVVIATAVIAAAALGAWLRSRAVRRRSPAATVDDFML